MIKSQKKLGIERTCLNIIKSYNKPIANIMPNWENLKEFPEKSGIRQGWSTLPTLIPYNSLILSKSNEARERNKKDTNRKKRSNYLYFQMICSYTENALNTLPETSLNLMNTFSKLAEYKVNI
jgi:hypothetical protein